MKLSLIVYRVNNIECGADKFYDLLFQYCDDFLLFKKALKELDRNSIVKIQISSNLLWYQFERIYIDEEL